MPLTARVTLRIGVTALCVGLAACGSAPPQPPFEPTPIDPAPTTVTLAGFAVEFTAAGEQRPVPNLRLKVRRSGPTGGAIAGTDLGDVITDANGLYTIPDAPVGLLWFQTAPGSDSRFLCEWWPVDVRPRRPTSPSTNLPVVHRTWSDNRPPPNMWHPGTSAWGTVTEQVDGNPQPLADAVVVFGEGTQDPPATTSASGFYMICSEVGTDQMRRITASKPGYDAVAREYFAGLGDVIHFQLTRK
jgi:hypothetical protein